MIPYDRLNQGALDQLLRYLTEELRRAIGQRYDLEQKWIKYQKGYRCEPDRPVKNFPFANSANLVIPVLATDVDTVYSRLMGLLFAPDNLWSCKPLNENMVEFAARLQEFLEWAQDHELNAYEAISDAIKEMCLLGTGIIKTRYKRQVQDVYQFRESDNGTVDQVISTMIHDHPTMERVALYDFYVPAASRDLQTAPWCAERIMLTWQDMVQRVNAGIYTNVDRLGAWWAQSRGSRVEQNMQRLDAYIPGLGDRFELFEFWTKYDISATGRPIAVVCTIHLESNTYLRVDYNPFFNQEYPYAYGRYLREPGRFYGIGLGEMLEQAQEEISTMHNQRIDSHTLANTTMFKVLKSSGIKQNEPVFPGRMWMVDSLDDITPMPIGGDYANTIPDEQMTLSYGQRRTGVNDYVTGTNDPSIGYATGATNLSMMREGAKRFDQVLREVRRLIGESGRRAVELYQQFNQNGKEYLAMGPKDGAMVHAVLQFPLELIRAGVGVDVTATSAALNKEVQIRTNTMVMQMIQQMYMQIYQAMQIALNPQMPPVMQQLAMQMALGTTTLMRRVLDDYGIQDASALVPNLQQSVQYGQAASQQPALNGATPMGAGPSQPSGVSALSSGGGGIAGYLPSANGNGNGVGTQALSGGGGGYGR